LEHLTLAETGEAGTIGIVNLTLSALNQPKGVTSAQLHDRFLRIVPLSAACPALSVSTSLFSFRPTSFVSARGLEPWALAPQARLAWLLKWLLPQAVSSVPK
jgi:hypothetical protein